MAAEDARRDEERRQATALFIDISGFTLLSERRDPETVRRVVRPLLARFKLIVERHGGSVNQTQGDAVFAVFGIPVAIEHAARAAVNAAIEMHNDTDAYNREPGIGKPLSVHTGIYTGLIFAGSGLVQEIDVNSGTVNRAARLKDEAPPGSIWIGDATWRGVRDEFEFLPPETMEFKNVEVPIEVYEVVSRTPFRGPDRRRALPFVGRKLERARLEQTLANLALGRGGVVSVVGDAGLGKSRLVAELRASDAARDVLWLEGRSQQFGSDLSFHPFADLLRSWAGIGEHESGAPLLAQLEKAASQLFDEGAEDVVPFLATLIGVEPGPAGRERLAGITGEAMDRLVLDAMSQLLGRLADRGRLALVFDDLHWADVSSLELLGPLLRLAVERPILFVLLLRPDPPRTREVVAAAVAGAARLRHEEIALRLLDREAADDLIDRIFEGGDVPNATRRLIEERTGGNPLYVGEVVRALLEQGAFERRGEALFATPKEVDSIAIPPTVQEVIAARVDRLPESARRVLYAVAILGGNAYRRILEAIVERADLDSDLAALDEARLLEARERAGETIHLFAHPLIEEVVYEGISLYERTDVHVRIARAIEETLSPSGAGYHAMLARHWSRAAAGLEELDHPADDERQRAVRELSLACEAGGAISEALHFLEEAARLLLEMRDKGDDSRTRVLIHSKLGLAYLRRAGKMREGNLHLDDALVLFGQRRRGTSTRRRALRFGWAAASVFTDLYLRRESRRRPPATDKDRDVIDLMVASAQAQVTADPTGFLFDSMEGLHRLSRVDPASVAGAGGIYAGAAGFIAYTGLSAGVGERLLRRAERYVNADDPREHFGYRVFAFVHHFLAGDWSDRFAIEPEVVEENLRLGEFWHVINYLPLEAKRRAHQGRFGEAAEVLERIGKIGERYDYDLARSNEHAVRMFLELERDRRREALVAAEAYLAGFDEEIFNLLALGTRAKIELLLGKRAAAEATLARAREIEKRTRVVPPFHAGGIRTAELRLALAQLEEVTAGGVRSAPIALRWRIHRAAARAVAAARKAAWQRPEAWALAGSCAWLLGRRRSAFRAWDEAIDEAERLGMRPELGRTWLEIGRRLGTGGHRFRGLDADGCCARGHEILRSLGLEADAGILPRSDSRASDD